VPARIHAQAVVLHVPDAAEKRLPYNGAHAVEALSMAPMLLGAFFLIAVATPAHRAANW
jgi:hypothetical protein